MSIMMSTKKTFEDAGYVFISQEEVINSQQYFVGDIDESYCEIGTAGSDSVVLTYDNRETMEFSVLHGQDRRFIVSRDYNDDTWSLAFDISDAYSMVDGLLLVDLKDVGHVVRHVMFHEPLDETVIKKNKPKLREAYWAKDISDVTIVCIDDIGY